MCDEGLINARIDLFTKVWNTSEICPTLSLKGDEKHADHRARINPFVVIYSNTNTHTHIHLKIYKDE